VIRVEVGGDDQIVYLERIPLDPGHPDPFIAIGALIPRDAVLAPVKALHRRAAGDALGSTALLLVVAFAGGVVLMRMRRQIRARDARLKAALEHAPDGNHGFEGRYREVVPPERLAMTFDWDGNPGHVSVTTITLEDLGAGRTRVTTKALFHTPEERDGMLEAGMVDGMNASYAALDKVLADLA